VSNFNKKIGSRGERKAAEWLLNNGYKVITQNYTCSIGEIDLVAKIDDVVCFVEVKARQGGKFGIPAEAVTATKRWHIRRTAELFILRERELAGIDIRTVYRFDVCQVLIFGEFVEINYIENAF
jgi:putative endonuclease